MQSAGLADVHSAARLLLSAQKPEQQGSAVEQSPSMGAHAATSHVQGAVGLGGQATGGSFAFAAGVTQVSPAPAQQSASTRHDCETLEQVVAAVQIPSSQKSPPPAGS